MVWVRTLPLLAAARRAARDEAAEGAVLRVVGLRDDLDPKPEIMTGAFVRKEDRQRYDGIRSTGCGTPYAIRHGWARPRRSRENDLAETA